MEKVKIHEVIIYEFDCPKCKERTETFDEPAYLDTVECHHCGEVYEIEE